MAAIQLNAIELPFQSPITLEEPFSSDVWPVSKWDLYKTARKKDQQYFNAFGYQDSSFVFTGFNAEAAKTEFKYFLSTCITKGCTLRTATEHYSRGKHIFSYLQEHPEIQSIVDIEENDYTRFLLNEGVIDSKYVGDGTFISGQMKPTATKRKNRTITLLLHIQNVVNDIYEDYIPEQNRDYWRLKKFPFLSPDNISDWKNLNFKRIPQRSIREQTKRVFYTKIKYENPMTLYNKLMSLTIFFRWLYEKHPDVTDLNQLSRKTIEGFMEYLRLESGYSATLVNRHILNVKKYLEDGYLIDSEHFPEHNLILSTDYRVKPLRNADFYSDKEISNINAVLPKMPTMYASIVLCLELLALRISDLVTLTPSMIEMSREGALYQYKMQLSKKLVKEQQKTSNMIYIPIPNHVYRILRNQIKLSKEKYGEDVKYIFATGKDTHVAKSTVSRMVNNYFYKFSVLSDSGNILRFKSHKFRATKATKLIGQGFGATEAARTLGHASLNSLSYYTNVTDDTLISNLDPYLNKVQIIIENRGKGVEQIKKSTEKILPLCNGWCCRPIALGVCEHANKCLSCTLFKPDNRHINYYKLQLQELEATYSAAKALENDSLLTKTEEDIKAVKKIIEEVERLCKQKEIHQD